MQLNLRPELQQVLDDAGIDATALNEVQLTRSIHAALRQAQLPESGLLAVLEVLRTGRERSQDDPVETIKRALRKRNDVTALNALEELVSCGT